MLLKRHTETGRKVRGWIVAPTFPLVREDWIVSEQLLKDAITSKKQTDMRMDFGRAGFIEFKSAEREDEGLRGAGLDFAVLDEASRISKKSWEYGIRPALADKLGRAIFISTPKGRNWFYDLWLRGQSEDKEIKSWQYDTKSNPYFPQSEWASIEKTTPELILKQEYLADFLQDEASVFKNLERCYRGRLEEPKEGERYTVGLDLGKTEDFTVATVIRNSTSQVVDIYRENKVDWSLQKMMVKAISQKYFRPKVIIDSTGLGDPIAEDLRKSGINIEDFKFTNSSKQELVEGLIVAIEQGLVGIPVCDETQFLINEIKSFTYEILTTGRIRYNAPEGLHDDGVISLGLAIRGIKGAIHRNNPIKEEKKKWGTANDWERLYDEIDREAHSFYPEDRAFAIQRIKAKRLQSKLMRVM